MAARHGAWELITGWEDEEERLPGGGDCRWSIKRGVEVYQAKKLRDRAGKELALGAKLRRRK